MLSRVLALRKTFTSYAVRMHQAWLRDPASVGSDWAVAFEAGKTAPVAQSAELTDEMKSTTYQLINCYKIRGHESATIDALNLNDSL